MRRYISPDDEFVVKIKALGILELHNDVKKEKLEKRFSEKYGKEEKWTDEIFEKYDKEEAEQVKKTAEISGKIITEVLEILSNQDNIENYLKYLNIFFGKEEKRTLGNF